MFRVNSIVVATLIAVSAVGCASSGSNTNPAEMPAAPPRTLPAATANGSLVYVSDTAKNLIAVFDRSGTVIGTITQGLKYPSGLFVDSAHNLWVANAGDSNVLEFARGGTKPIATLSDGSAYTQDVTICPNGNIYVATLLGAITEYTGKKHRMAGSLGYDGMEFQFVTCDRAGNVFATGVLGTNGQVVEFAGGTSSGAKLLPINSPGNLNGIKPDNAGNILVVFGPTVNEYTEDGNPTGVEIPMNGNWLDIALSRDGKVLLGANETANAGTAVTFPGGKPRATYSDSFSQVWGVAFDPGQKGM
jgi:hypothetical protein